MSTTRRARALRGDRARPAPIVATEERRAGAHLVRAGRAVQARDEVGLRALNDALRSAFDAPGGAGFERGGTPRTRGRRRIAARAGRAPPAAASRHASDVALPVRCASSSRPCACIRARIAAFAA